ncbi:MAG: EamA family transporter [Methanotrichaceae archaeon]|nr:EamA family transporter [Methanotrichaceae archaeon]
MDWLFLSLLGAASLAVTGVIDKFILGRYVRDPLTYLIALVVMQQILVVAIPAYMGWGYVFPQTLYALATGGCQVILWGAYLLALQVEETSRVAALVYVFPVFVFLGAFLFLGETLAAKDYAGGALLVCSALLISYRPAKGASPAILSPAIKYMAVFWVFTAAYALAAKYLLAFMSEWHLILWSSLGSLLAVLPLLGREAARREFAAYFRSGRFLFLALLTDEIFDFLGRGAFIFAYALGSVALVSSVAALQPFITLVYIILLGLFIPGILHEELDRKTVALKTVAILLIAVGVYLVS